MRAKLLPALIPFFLSAAFAADKVVGGPYVIHAGGTSATVSWVVETAGANVADGPVLRSERSELNNLKPGTKVNYDVFEGKSYGKGSFRTAAPAGASFEFVVYGDTRTRHDLHRKVVDGIGKAGPDFVIHTGDLVTNGNDAAQWPVFFEIESDLLRKTAFFPVLGNHERNDRRFYEFFGVTLPYYSFDWGSVHFTMLDSDIANVASTVTDKEKFWADQMRWLEEDLVKAGNAEFRIVVLHHPPFSAVKKRQVENKAVDDVVPLMEKYRVSAVFAGHDHNYQRHVKNGVTYIVTGGGGAPLYPVDGPIPGVTQKLESTEHFVLVKVRPGKITTEAVALDGRTIESVALAPFAAKELVAP